MWSVNAVCTPPSEQCFFNECDECRDAGKFQSLTLPNDASEELITVSLWVKKENPVLKVKQVVKEKQLKPLAELFEVITDVLLIENSTH
jgi:hypothetical protein